MLKESIFDGTRVRQLLAQYFNIDELKNLCIDIKINYENLGGEGIEGKARELVAYVQRRGKEKEAELLVKCQELRPHVNWTGTPAPPPPPRPTPPRLTPGTPGSNRTQSSVWEWITGNRFVSIIAIITLLVSIAALARDLLDFNIEGGISSPKSTPTVPITPTISPFTLANVDLRTVKSYSYTGGLFTINVPAAWDTEPPRVNQPDRELRVRFTPQENVDIFWLVEVAVIDLSGDLPANRQLSPADMRGALDRYLRNHFGPLPGFRLDVTQPSSAGVKAFWWISLEPPGEAAVAIRGESQLIQWGDRLSLVTIYLPEEQFEKQEDAVAAIFDSIEIDLDAPFPSE